MNILIYLKGIVQGTQGYFRIVNYTKSLTTIQNKSQLYKRLYIAVRVVVHDNWTQLYKQLTSCLSETKAKASNQISFWNSRGRKAILSIEENEAGRLAMEEYHKLAIPKEISLR